MDFLVLVELLAILQGNCCCLDVGFESLLEIVRITEPHLEDLLAINIDSNVSLTDSGDVSISNGDNSPTKRTNLKEVALTNLKGCGAVAKRCDHLVVVKGFY